MSEGPHGQTRKLEAQRVLADARLAAFHARDPITPTPGLALSYPLRPDFLAQVVIPRDMTVSEARRLSAFVMTLTVDAV